MILKIFNCRATCFMKLCQDTTASSFHASLHTNRFMQVSLIKFFKFSRSQLDKSYVKMMNASSNSFGQDCAVEDFLNEEKLKENLRIMEN